MSYNHPRDINLRNLHKTMEYNSAGQPVIRVKTDVHSTPGGFNNSSSADAFGRMRVSEPFTIFDSSFRYHDDTEKWNHTTSGGGLVAHLTNESSIRLSLGTADGDSVIRETKRVFPYQPGKSLLILCTFVMNIPKDNLRQRVGYFGVNDGIYFMTEHEEKYLVIRKSTSGSTEDTSEKISQNNWNIDTLDGTGPSGLTLDVTKSQIFWCDIEWLGVGSVRAGFVINGVFVTCHVFHHANLISSVYMKSAVLPIRYEITNTGITDSTSSMKQICSTVISEGGYNIEGRFRTASTSSFITGKNISNSTFTPVVSIRMKSSRLDSIVIPVKFDVFGIQSNAFQYGLIYNPSLDAGTVSWQDAGSDSSVEYDLSAVSLSGGDIIETGVFVGGQKGGGGSLVTSEGFVNQLGRTLTGVSDIFTLAVKATTNNDDAAGSISWKEIS